MPSSRALRRQAEPLCWAASVEALRRADRGRLGTEARDVPAVDLAPLRAGRAAPQVRAQLVEADVPTGRVAGRLALFLERVEEGQLGTVAVRAQFQPQRVRTPGELHQLRRPVREHLTVERGR